MMFSDYLFAILPEVANRIVIYRDQLQSEDVACISSRLLRTHTIAGTASVRGISM